MYHTYVLVYVCNNASVDQHKYMCELKIEIVSEIKDIESAHVFGYIGAFKSLHMVLSLLICLFVYPLRKYNCAKTVNQRTFPARFTVCN